jgi:hypothetical protein
MLFARGVWSIFGIRDTSLAKFAATLDDPAKLYGLSQFVASAKTKFEGGPSFGINPFAEPRKDENVILSANQLPFAPGSDPEAIKMEDFLTAFGPTAADYSLGDNQFAFWVVLNDFEDVTDPKSKQEAQAYKDAGKPFKFLSKDEKKLIEANVAASACASRTQFPVLVDFNSQTVFVASSNVDQVGVVRSLIEALGGEPFSLAWQFDGLDWPKRFLKAVNEGMMDSYHKAMAERAEELSRFRPEEVEKLDDKMMESVVTSFFALSELPTGMWAGLRTPARIKLFKSGDPAAAGNPSVAFSLLKEFTDGEIAAASVVFQSLDSKFTKNDEERWYRTDLFAVDINDNVNLTDAGAAMLRGFDLPRFKKEMKQHAKNQNDALQIKDYWKDWLSAMKTAAYTLVDNVTETLEIDKEKYGLKPYEGEDNAADAAGGSNG